MQQHTQPLKKDQTQKGAVHAWLIGAVAIVALILGWAAFNRSGEDVVPTAVREAEEARQEIADSAREAAREAEEFAAEVVINTRIAAARAEARLDLLAIQAMLEADATYEDVQEGLDEVNTDLEAAYANTSAELRAEYQDIQQDLESLENSIRNQTGDALDAIADLSLKLETNARTDAE